MFLSVGCSVEVWSVATTSRLSVVGSNESPSSVRSVCVSDFLLVVMYHTGQMRQWKLQVIQAYRSRI